MGANCLLSLVVALVLGAHAAQEQDVRVKLCGRDFIRMVVTSCGSSRVKRSNAELGHHHGNHRRAVLDWLNSDQFSNLRTSETETDRDKVTQRDPHTTESLTQDQQTHLALPSTPQQVDVDQEYITIPAVYTVPSRTQRDVGPAGVCCRSGCTMSELVQYC